MITKNAIGFLLTLLPYRKVMSSLQINEQKIRIEWIYDVYSWRNDERRNLFVVYIIEARSVPDFAATRWPMTFCQIRCAMDAFKFILRAKKHKYTRTNSYVSIRIICQNNNKLTTKIKLNDWISKCKKWNTRFAWSKLLPQFIIMPYLFDSNDEHRCNFHKLQFAFFRYFVWFCVKKMNVFLVISAISKIRSALFENSIL